MVPEIWSATNNLKNKNFGKFFEDIIILHEWAINDNHMILGSYNMKHDRHNFVSFWAFFLAFTYPLPPNNPKNQNFLKTNENPADIIILHT